jgi:CheY-like chemotaxis protein
LIFVLVRGGHQISANLCAFHFLRLNILPIIPPNTETHIPVKILSIDDSKMVHTIIRRALTPYDVVLVTAQDGLSGIQTARTERPDLILLDINMPEIDGIETLHRLKTDQDLAPIPVILLTAENSSDHQESAFETGAFMYLTKPFTNEVLLAAIGGVLTLQMRPTS